MHAPFREAAPLFGPNGEHGWSEGRWNPRFFYPESGQDAAGAVFAIQHGSTESVWVTTMFDVAAHHFRYVYFIPDALVTTIDVNFSEIDAFSTKVTVVYTRTALDASANNHVRALGENDKQSGTHWQKAVDDYLQMRKR